jgi:hypothetical protein
LKVLKIAKKSFTLLEIVIALVLIGLCSTVVGIKITKAVEKHRFYSNAKLIEDKLNFCQKIALSSQEDIYFSIISLKHGSEYFISKDENKGLLFKKEKSKKFLKNLFFKNPENEKTPNEILFCFTSTGVILPKINLKLCHKKENYEYQIDLLKISANSINSK